ncbi:DUF6119 family protein [uncultured Sphingomonas sp.]|uniref:DUF6119 family protein n=1 Tax=uncultured Sphingomonas sp. TaxID=158754 RepID=UPI0025D138E3|nr:DUF6119 family protein [uncultured Sphingomonas sp.]
MALRLIRQGVEPADAVRAGVVLSDLPSLAGAKIAAGPVGGGTPNWAEFLGLTEGQKADLFQHSSYGLVFVRAAERWFAVAFGLGHAKLDAAAIEQDFGLRVVLNAVDHRKLKSADVRTPDANTLNRRSQASRGAERTVFEIDPERDIVRGLLGEPKDKAFATRISGNDSLSIRRKATVGDLPAICARAFELYNEDAYKAEFGWIDHIRHVRDRGTLAKLEASLVDTMTGALIKNASEVDEVSLAFPAMYDPDNGGSVTFRGYGSRLVYPDLEVAHYLQGLKDKGKAAYTADMLDSHFVQEVDEDGTSAGSSWKMRDCLVYETKLEGSTYTLSGGRWYKIDNALAEEVEAYFDHVAKVDLPAAAAGDNEKTYNAALGAAGGDLLSLDVQLVKPSDASSPIEVCDFLSKGGALIHIKDKSESSKLSHLFNQGLVSSVVLKRDGKFRDAVRAKIAAQPGGAVFEDIIPAADQPFDTSKFTVVFGVLVNAAPGKDLKLPFFSLISFRHAARRIANELGYGVAFAWIKKPGVGAGKKKAKAVAPDAPV